LVIWELECRFPAIFAGSNLSNENKNCKIAVNFVSKNATLCKNAKYLLHKVYFSYI
jgi:hypothetical protein